jgi:hypothetical protein
MSRHIAPLNIVEFSCGFTISGNIKDVSSKKNRHYRHCKICTANNIKIEPTMDTTVGNTIDDVKYHYERPDHIKLLTKFEDELYTTLNHPNSSSYKENHRISFGLNLIIQYMKKESMPCYNLFKMVTLDKLENMNNDELHMILHKIYMVFTLTYKTKS